jgi:hypothetical protein
MSSSYKLYISILLNAEKEKDPASWVKRKNGTALICQEIPTS